MGTLAPYFPSAGRSARGKRVRTPWVTYPDMYSAQCVSADGANWLQVTAIGGASDVRPKVEAQQGADWGFHVDDVNLALGSLVNVVAQQIRNDPR
jgi:hypothetical protein